MKQLIIVLLLFIYIKDYNLEFFKSKRQRRKEKRKAKRKARRTKRKEKKEAKKIKKLEKKECKKLKGKEKKKCKKEARKKFKKAKKEARKKKRASIKKAKDNFKNYYNDNIEKLLKENNILKLRKENKKQINDLKKDINSINNSLNNPNSLFDSVKNKCRANNSNLKISLKYDIIKKIIDVLTILLFVLILYKIIIIPIPFTYKFFKFFVFNGLLVFISLIYVIRKLIYPLMKTKIIVNTNVDLENISDIKNITIEKLKQFKNYKELSNSDIIKYVLNDGNIDVINKNSSITIREYFKYLFCRPEFRLFNFDIIRFDGFDVNEFELSKVYKNTIEWKNRLLEIIQYKKDLESNNKILNNYKKIKHFALMILYYNWPSLFDLYKNEEKKLQHISNIYLDIYYKYDK